MVEALEPLSFPPRYFAKLSFNQWAQRVSVTLAILDLLDELENVFEDPVHLCDVKPEHFGISDFGKVKVLDLDSVFLKSHLGKLFTPIWTCQLKEFKFPSNFSTLTTSTGCPNKFGIC